MKIKESEKIAAKFVVTFLNENAIAAEIEREKTIFEWMEGTYNLYSKDLADEITESIDLMMKCLQTAANRGPTFLSIELKVLSGIAGVPLNDSVFMACEAEEKMELISLLRYTKEVLIPALEKGETFEPFLDWGHRIIKEEGIDKHFGEELLHDRHPRLKRILDLRKIQDNDEKFLSMVKRALNPNNLPVPFIMCITDINDEDDYVKAKDSLEKCIKQRENSDGIPLLGWILDESIEELKNRIKIWEDQKNK